MRVCFGSLCCVGVSFDVNARPNAAEDTQWAFWDGMNEYQKKNKDYLQGQIGNPEGPEKPNKKYYDPRMSLRAGEETMADRLVKCMEDLKCIDRL